MSSMVLEVDTADSWELRNRCLSKTRSFSPSKYEAPLVRMVQPSTSAHNRVIVAAVPEKRSFKYSLSRHSAPSRSSEDSTSSKQKQRNVGRMLFVAVGILVICTTVLQHDEQAFVADTAFYRPLLRVDEKRQTTVEKKIHAKLKPSSRAGKSRERGRKTDQEYKQIHFFSNVISEQDPSRDASLGGASSLSGRDQSKDEEFLLNTFTVSEAESDDSVPRDTSRSKEGASPLSIGEDEIRITSFSLSERDSSIDVS